MIASQYKMKSNRLKYSLKVCSTCIEREKSMGINTVRLSICHHQIVEPALVHFSQNFLDFNMKYYFILSFFCWIGLDLILVLIPFCFGFLGSPSKCLFSQVSDIFFSFLFFFSYFGLQKSLKILILILDFRF